MNIAKSRLKQLIKEELSELISEKEALEEITKYSREGSEPGWELTGKGKEGVDFERWEPEYRMTADNPAHPDYVDVGDIEYRVRSAKKWCRNIAYQLTGQHDDDSNYGVRNPNDERAKKESQRISMTCKELVEAGMRDAGDFNRRAIIDELGYDINDLRVLDREWQKQNPDRGRGGGDGGLSLSRNQLSKYPDHLEEHNTKSQLLQLIREELATLYE